ncbi:acyl-CoA dehydrogenase [Azospirillum halopraeferens]|uniref:acyl-CoA dehydrogenase n=1 Tax=Azospirillum halopraeferens TaxID=34010 RepID=UPI0003F652A8|nr:acyl-CoA dehydrogenase [Azospirillum halopraeferens]
MPTYRAPLASLRFLLHDVLDAPGVLAGAGWAEVSAELIDDVLSQAARFTEEVIAPADAPADREGARCTADGVRLPEGLRSAYRAWVEGEWGGLAGDPAYGGQGLPEVLDTAVTEMVCGAGLAFSIVPGLTRGAVRAIAAHGGDALKARWLPPMVRGEWTGAMALTEPQAGTDLGLLRTRAEPAGDGTHRITGQKMFISAADHDLTDNVVHLVLARLPDAPPGTRGISLFLVPRALPDGARNAWRVLSVEAKMGLHASPTCVVAYDGATGWLVGEAHRGLPAMFTMMNHERLFVAVQGIGAGEAATGMAEAYARDRLQGRAPDGPHAPDRPADPITAHPDVRRMLLTARALTEAGRALALWTALAMDRAHHSGDPAVQREAEGWAALLTPVLKAAGTDFGFEAAVLAQQVMGGHGYIRDNDVERIVRDVRATQIYEGTNGVQALDLVGRKLAMDGGRPLRRLLDAIDGTAAALAADPDTAGLAAPLAAATDRLRGAVAGLGEAPSPLTAAAVATDTLRLLALVAYGWMWGLMALAAVRRRRAGGGDAAFLAGRLALARFFSAKLLPDTLALEARIRAGHATVTDPDGGPPGA